MPANETVAGTRAAVRNLLGGNLPVGRFNKNLNICIYYNAQGIETS